MVQLYLMGSLIAGGPAHLLPCIGPKIHFSMKVFHPMALTRILSLYDYTWKKKRGGFLYFIHFPSIIRKIQTNRVYVSLISKVRSHFKNKIIKYLCFSVMLTKINAKMHHLEFLVLLFPLSVGRNKGRSL